MTNSRPIYSTAPKDPLQQAIITGFLEIHRTNIAQQNQFWGWCRKTNRPYAILRRRKKYVAITLDYYTTDRRLTDVSQSHAEMIVRRCLREYGQVGAWGTWNRFGVDLWRIRPEDPAELLKALLLLASQPDESLFPLSERRKQDQAAEEFRGT